MTIIDTPLAVVTDCGLAGDDWATAVGQAEREQAKRTGKLLQGHLLGGRNQSDSLLLLPLRVSGCQS